MARYHVTIVRPRGYVHSSCFQEVAEGLCHGLQDCGHTVTSAENHLDPAIPTIVFGAHLYTPEQALNLPSTVIVYNLEQLGLSWTPPWYTRLAAWTTIWDYTPLNLHTWRALPSLAPPVLVPIGYDPRHRRLPDVPQQDIEVLFYGSLTDRRRRVLNALASAGFKVHSAFGVYGPERDALIARSKLVLNLHARDTGILEQVRIAHLLANSKAVVTEQSADGGHLEHALALCTLDDAVEVCRRLLSDSEKRHALERRGHELFAQKTQAQMLAEALA